MRKSILKILTPAAIALSVIVFTSCEKEEGVIDSNDLETIQDIENTLSEELVDGYFEDSDDLVMEINDEINFLNGRGKRDDRSISRCAEVTHDADSKTIVVDFGEGCEGPGGKVRSGKIIITYTDRKLTPGSVWTYTFEDYFVDDIALEGTKTITNLTEEDSDVYTYNKVLTGGKAIWPDGDVATWEMDKTFSWIKAEDPGDDEFHVTGTANGVGKEGNSYSMEILETLIYKRACRRAGIHLPVSGVKEVDRDGEIATIDFGDGDCDYIVTITKEGVSEEVDLSESRNG